MYYTIHFIYSSIIANSSETPLFSFLFLHFFSFFCWALIKTFNYSCILLFNTLVPARMSIIADPQLVDPSGRIESRAPRGEDKEQNDMFDLTNWFKKIHLEDNHSRWCLNTSRTQHKTFLAFPKNKKVLYIYFCIFQSFAKDVFASKNFKQ